MQRVVQSIGLIRELRGVALTECASGSRFFSLYFVENGAEMMEESTIVPFFRIIPPFDPFQKFSLVRADFFQFVVQKRHAHLFIHGFIIPCFCLNFKPLALRGVALSAEQTITYQKCLKLVLRLALGNL